MCIETLLHRNAVTPSAVKVRRLEKMATLMSVEAVRRKILTLQQAAYDAEERAEMWEREADAERQARERVKPKRAKRGPNVTALPWQRDPSLLSGRIT